MNLAIGMMGAVAHGQGVTDRALSMHSLIRTLTMTHHFLIRSALLGCMLTALSGLAMADIVQCIDETKSITYTDIPCQDGTVAAHGAASAKSSAASATTLSRAATFAAAGKVREAALQKKPLQHRNFALDVATLEAARSSMASMDEASSLLRQQKVASLDQKDQHWFNF